MKNAREGRATRAEIIVSLSNMQIRDFLVVVAVVIRELDDDGNKNPTNLHIGQWKTEFLHALHVRFSSLDILKTFSFFLRREMIGFAVVWTT